MIASEIYISPSGGKLELNGFAPPVKISLFDFLALKSPIPAKNLSGSDHSIIFDSPGGKCLPPLKTTIPSAKSTKE